MMNSGTSVENVLLVVIDALRWDKVGVFGSESGLTPNIDALARRGTAFEWAFSTTNATDPSLTSIHTGRFPRSTVYHHGEFVTAAEKERVEATSPLPARLRDAGINTVAVGRPMGRWHRRGFQTYPAVPKQSSKSVVAKVEEILIECPRLYHAARYLNSSFNSLSGRKNRTKIPDYEPLYREHEPGTDPIDTLDAAMGTNRTYGFVHLMDTHTPYLPKPSILRERLKKGTYDHSELSLADREQSLVKPSKEDFDYGVGRLVARYDAAVIEADRKVGRLLELLDNRGIRDETAVIVTSDHGENMTEHGILCDHHGLYDQSIRVPLVIDIPDNDGSRVAEFVQLTDLMPTILELFDETPPVGIHGQSLISLVGHYDKWTSRSAVVAEEAHTQRKVAIRTRDHKYIEHEQDEVLELRRGSSLVCGYCGEVHGGERELYDLQTDPTESRNIFSEQPKTAERLRTQLREFLSALTPPEGMEKRAEYEDEEAVIQRLEELGYR